MFPTMTSPEIANDADNLFVWTALVVLLIMGPLEVLILYAAMTLR